MFNRKKIPKSKTHPNAEMVLISGQGHSGIFKPINVSGFRVVRCDLCCKSWLCEDVWARAFKHSNDHFCNFLSTLSTWQRACIKACMQGIAPKVGASECRAHKAHMHAWAFGVSLDPSCGCQRFQRSLCCNVCCRCGMHKGQTRGNS